LWGKAGKDISNVGASSNPCAENYHGASALSAPATRNLYNYIQSLENVLIFIDVHTYGQLILYPSGYYCESQDSVKDNSILHRAAEVGMSYLQPNWLFGPGWYFGELTF